MLVRSDFKSVLRKSAKSACWNLFIRFYRGYDSVHLKADVELGGSDQKFNLLMGRQLQEAFGLKPQVDYDTVIGRD